VIVVFVKSWHVSLQVSELRLMHVIKNYSKWWTRRLVRSSGVAESYLSRHNPHPFRSRVESEASKIFGVDSKLSYVESLVGKLSSISNKIKLNIFITVRAFPLQSGAQRAAKWCQMSYILVRNVVSALLLPGYLDLNIL